MGHEDRLLLDRLCRHEAHRATLHGLTDRLGIEGIALAALHVWDGTPDIELDYGDEAILRAERAASSTTCFRKATIIASSSGLRTVERTYFGPIGASETKSRFRHLATVFGLKP